MKKYNPQKIEKKWQEEWDKKGLYKTVDSQDKPKYYILDMFPYPSGVGLHVGHPKGYIATDIIARMKMMQGHNVLHPMGWDAFGLPAENFAIKNKVHPREMNERNIATFKKQLSKLGFTYDWRREINTTDPDFYKWTQWTFLQMFKKGLAYESYEPINWCPKCQTGLANEDLEDGKCERCDSEIEQKPMRQWVLKITDYAERMLKDLDKLSDWPVPIKEMQKNWIGKSEGALLKFQIKIKEEKLRTKVVPRGGAIATEEVRPREVILSNKNSKLDKEIIGTGVLMESKCGSFLFQKRDNNTKANPNKIALFGGGINKGETSKECAVREIKEELSINIKEKDLKDIGIFEGHVRRSTYMRIFGIKNIDKKNLNIQEGEKIIEMSLEEALKNKEVTDFTKEVIREFQNSIEVFTTRPDTLFGATYMVVAPEHELITNYELRITNFKEVQKYVEKARNKTEMERVENKGKTGVELKGIKAINPVNNKEMPIFVADYVLSGYGTGAIMAVPAHDERDFEFATRYNESLINADLTQKDVEKIEIKQVIAPVFKGEGENAIREDKSMTERRNVDVIIKHWKEDKFFVLDWNKSGNNWYSFVVGGVEKGETLEEAALRETREETGYKNIKVIKQIGGKIHSYFYARHKEVNRAPVKRNCIYIELIDGELEELAKEHTKNHDGIWVEKDKILEKINLPELQKYWQIFNKQEEELFIGSGELINSDQFDGMTSEKAKKVITEFVGGEMTVNYKLKDWVFSRQRYWGEPIPIVHCEKCGAVSVPEKELPVVLPEVKSYEPTGTGESPLADIKDWVNTKCPKCGGKAKRETNTMPQWAGSSWYYLRYIDPNNKKELVDKEKEKYWSPVNFYVGGAEHATRHLIYARFWHKFLFDIGVVSYEEPFTRLQNVGLIMAEDGRKMSKRWGNVINPDDVIKEFGADSLRIYEMFMGPFDQSVAWNTKGLVGAKRFLEKVWRLFKEKELIECGAGKCGDVPKEIPPLFHKTIKKVTEDIEAMNFNTAISQMMIFVNECTKHKVLPKSAMEKFLILLAPFAPHIAEELWAQLREEQLIFDQQWPKYNLDMIKDESIELVVQVNGKVRDKIQVSTDISEEKAKEKALSSKKIQKYFDGQKIKKVIFVPNRLINFVV